MVSPRHIGIYEIAKNLRAFISTVKDKYLKKKVRIEDIPIHELVVLCRYFSIGLVTEMFGGTHQQISPKIGIYIRENRKFEDYDDDGENINPEDGDFTPKEPAGIGNYKYAARLERKVNKELERVINQGVTAAGLQLVNAAKLILTQTSKTKDDAIALMDAYQEQLLVLADHIVVHFLPALRTKIKEEFDEEKDLLLERINEYKNNLSNDAMVAIIEREVDRFARQIELKKFELYLAESMTDNKKVREAFNFSHDLIDTYMDEEKIVIDSKAQSLIKQSQEDRIGT